MSEWHEQSKTLVNSYSLFQAAKTNNLALARSCLELGHDVNVRNSRGQTPLFIAAEKGHAEIAKTLLKHGARLDSADLKGTTPLMKAASKRRMSVVQMLLSFRDDLNASDKTGKAGHDFAKLNIFVKQEEARKNSGRLRGLGRRVLRLLYFPFSPRQ